MSKASKKEAVPVSDAQLADLGIERDYTAERDARVIPFVKDLFKEMGGHEFVFAAGSQSDVKELDAMIVRLQERAPTEVRTEEEQKKIDDALEKLIAQRKTIDDEIKSEDNSFHTFYEQKFITPALTRQLRVSDINYTFGLANMAVEMLKSRATSPDSGTELRLKPAALEILAKLGEEEKLMLVVDEKEDPSVGQKRAELYQRLYNDVVVPIFDKYEVKYNEVMQVFGILQSILMQLKLITDKTIKGAQDIALAKLWGVEDSDDITIQQLHEKCIEK